MPGLPHRGNASISNDATHGLKLPGTPIQITPNQYRAQSQELEPYVISFPPKLDAESGLFVSYFTAEVGDGYNYYKVYGQTPADIEETVHNFQAIQTAKFSPQGEFNTALNKVEKGVKNNIEELDEQLDKLKNEFERASNNEKKKNSQIIELLEDRRERLTGELNATLRVKALD